MKKIEFVTIIEHLSITVYSFCSLIAFVRGGFCPGVFVRRVFMSADGFSSGRYLSWGYLSSGGLCPGCIRPPGVIFARFFVHGGLLPCYGRDGRHVCLKHIYRTRRTSEKT